MLNGKACWLLKSILVFTLLMFPPAVISQEMEQEPNDPCSSAQILGEVVLPYYIDGSVDNYDTSDYFRFTAEPDTYLVANLDGILGIYEPLAEPYIALYDSSCNYITSSNYAFLHATLKFEVPADGEFVLRASDYFFYYPGSYQLSVDVTSPPSTISGRLVDADTGSALPGDTEPYSQAILYECYTAECLYPSQINQQSTDSDGRFSFESSWYSGFLNAGTYQVEGRANGYITTRTDPQALAEDEQLDIGDLGLPPQTYADSVTGRLVDAVTGEPLPGNTWPYAWVELGRCNDGPTCSWSNYVNSASADAEGVFILSTDYMSNPLITGWYRVYASAWDYDPAYSEAFELTENEQEDLGDLELMPPPILFTEVRPCGDLPPEGGKCRYSVRVVSNLPEETELGAWSLVEVSGTGSELGWSKFQAGQPRELELETGESKVVRFSFEVPDTVQNGAYICPDIWAGLGEKIPYFEPLAHENPLFCITKGLTGTYSVLPKQAAKAVIRVQRSHLDRQ